MRHIQIAMAALSLSAIAAALVIVVITSAPRVENVWDLKACAKGAASDQTRCCDVIDGVLQDNGGLGKCVAPPPDPGPPGSQHDLSDIGSETLTPSPLRTHDPSGIGTETFTQSPTSTPVPTPMPSPATTQAPPTNPCMNPLVPVCAN
jgi:hypothetical protein